MFDRVTLLWPRYSPLEERLLTAVRDVLPPGARRVFDAQASAVTLVQRSPATWTEICLYRMRRRKADWRAVPLFPRIDEFRLAEVRFASAGRPFRTTLTCIDGHIFDFATTPGPKSVGFAPWDGEPATRLLTDPLSAAPSTPAGARIPDGWQQLADSYRAAPTPSGWVVHDAASAYLVMLDQGEFLVLAERAGDEFVLQRLEADSDGLFHLPAHDGVPAPIRDDIQTLLGGR